MNWEAIGALSEFVGAIAVVITLVYLAIQIRQNTRAIRLDTGHDITEEYRDIFALMAENRELAELVHRAAIDPESIRPLLASLVRDVLEEAEHLRDSRPSRLGYTEAEAAELLGVPRHVLRDARLRGELEVTLVGKRIVYTPEQLQTYLAKQRWRAR